MTNSNGKADNVMNSNGKAAQGKAKQPCATETKGENMCDDEYVDVCFECTANGDDYGIDENGHLVSCCDDCWVSMANDWSDDND